MRTGVYDQPDYDAAPEIPRNDAAPDVPITNLHCSSGFAKIGLRKTRYSIRRRALNWCNQRG